MDKTEQIMELIKSTVLLYPDQATGVEKAINNSLNDGFFKITSVSRADLEQEGFDVSKVDDDTMIQLASKLANDYCEQLFWSSLVILAEDYFKIPRTKQ